MSHHISYHILPIDTKAISRPSVLPGVRISCSCFVKVSLRKSKPMESSLECIVTYPYLYPIFLVVSADIHNLALYPVYTVHLLFCFIPIHDDSVHKNIHTISIMNTVQYTPGHPIIIINLFSLPHAGSSLLCPRCVCQCF